MAIRLSPGDPKLLLLTMSILGSLPTGCWLVVGDLPEPVDQELGLDAAVDVGTPLHDAGEASLRDNAGGRGMGGGRAGGSANGFFDGGSERDASREMGVGGRASMGGAGRGGSAGRTSGGGAASDGGRTSDGGTIGDSGRSANGGASSGGSSSGGTSNGGSGNGGMSSGGASSGGMSSGGTTPASGGSSPGCITVCDCDNDGAIDRACSGGNDCDDHDPRAKPSQDSYFPTASANASVGFDYDCSGTPDRDPNLNVTQSCTEITNLLVCDATTARYLGAIPECGQGAPWGRCRRGALGLACENDVIVSDQVMRCK